MPLPRFLFVLFFSILTSVILGSCGDTQQSALSGNLLGGETSPYLLQHASNPVHWKPWDESVFERAREEKKLVLVSIGYSSCHWCHVMEKETFEDDSVAAFMNKNFISIKVDREERPDVDEVYMTAVQLMTGSGGWPLNVVVLPNGKPIYGGTYHSRERWIEVLTEVQHQYEKDPVKLSEYADRVAQGVAEVNLIPAPEQTLEQQDISIEEAVLLWQSRWDTQWGGNAGVQKFMVPPNLTFLLNYTQLTQDQNSRDHLKTTLDRMAYGGVFDQIGGGFYRYSTDPRWHVPHFEKMLYDNAQLLSVYSKGFKLFSNPEYRRTVQAIFSFLKRDMRAPGGGYFAALDADSEGEEGKYYRWEESELREVLEGDYELFSHYYSVEPEMAWENQFYIPYRKTSDQEFAKSHNLKPDEFLLQKEGWNQKLMDKRSQRILPGIDDKIITSWNALLIIGLADSYDAFGEEEYLSEARDLYAFIKDHSYADGNLKHSYKPGDKRAMGFLEDYAFLARAAFRLYQITAESEYLEDATNLLDEIQKRFSDAESPLFRYREQSGLVSQILKTDDGVMPSPNTIIAGLFFELGHFYYIPEYLDKSRKMVTALQERFLKMPENYAGWGRLMLQQQKPYFEVAVAGPQALSLRDEMAKEFLPDVLLVASKTESDLPLFESRFDPETTWIYVCQDHTCQLPVSEVSQALRQIQDMDPRIFP